jgi:hypothetical protein
VGQRSNGLQRWSVQRLAARDGSVSDVNDPDQQRYIAAQRIYFAVCDPRSRADLTLSW